MDDRLRDQMQVKLREIHQVLKELLVSNQPVPISLMGGLSGITLFLYYYAHYTQQQEDLDHADEILQRVLDQPANGKFSLADGMAGVGWLVQHLSNEKLLDADTNAILDDLDQELFLAARTQLEQGNYDFLHGAMGVFHYYLERLPHSKGVRDLTDELVDILQTLACKTDSTNFWKWTTKTPEGEIVSHDRYNLGLSHGIPAITTLLSKYGSETRDERISIMASKSLNFVLEARYKLAGTTWCYPYFSNEFTNVGRLAWCYGDLSIALALFNSGQLLHNHKALDEARRVINHSLTKRSLTENGIGDACLCHGSAGLGHIYQVWATATGDPRYQECSEYWFRKTLDLSFFDDGLAGYKNWQPRIGWFNNYSLLEGVAGTGLALISALQPRLTRWNKCLLISL